MGVDRDSASVVDDGDPVAGFQTQFNAAGMTGDGLVHGIVQDFGDQVVQRVLIGAADVHARAAAYRLQAFQHLDILGRVTWGRVTGRRSVAVREEIRHAARPIEWVWSLASAARLW